MGIKNKFLALITVIAIILIIVSGVGYYNSQKQLTESIDESLAMIVSHKAGEVDSWVMSKVTKLSTSVNAMPFMPVQVKNSNAIVNGLNDDKDVESFYFGNEDGSFFERDNDPGVPADFNPRTRDWYIAAKQKNGLIFTDVYQDAGTKANIVTVAMPYKNVNGNLQGVFGMDISLKVLNEIAKQININGHGNGFIISSKDGKLLTQSDGDGQKTIDSQASEAFQKHWQEIQVKESGKFTATVNGKEMLFSYAKADNSGWIVGIMVEKSVVYSELTTMKINYGLLTLLSIIVLLFLGLRFAKMITVPIIMLTKSASKMADGDLQSEKLQITTNDEIGMLVKAFNDMSDNLRQLITQVSGSSEKIARASQDLTAGANQSAEAANHVAETVVHVADGMQNQMHTLDVTADEVAIVAKEISQVAEQSTRVSEISDKTVVQAKQGQDVMTKAIDQIGRMEKAVTDSAAVVSRLGSSSQQIGQIVDTISGIAGQTNLLALNAAIEAARAGEQGKGFAVVAEEVRKLAEQSQQATEEITKLIESIQSDTAQAVESMNSGSKEVAAGAESIQEVGTAFSAIIKMVQEITDDMRDIARSVMQVSDGSDKIVRAIEKINSVSQAVNDQTQSISAATEEQSASTEEIASSSRTLSHMAEDMRKMVDKFKI